MTQDSNPSAKAAQQIVQLCGVRIMELNVAGRVDLSGLTKKATEERIATMIEMALSDSLRPYRELIKKWRKDNSTVNPRGGYTDTDAAYAMCADELEAILNKEGT